MIHPFSTLTSPPFLKYRTTPFHWLHRLPHARLVMTATLWPRAQELRPTRNAPSVSADLIFAKLKSLKLNIWNVNVCLFMQCIHGSYGGSLFFAPLLVLFVCCFVCHFCIDLPRLICCFVLHFMYRPSPLSFAVTFHSLQLINYLSSSFFPQVIAQRVPSSIRTTTSVPTAPLKVTAASPTRPSASLVRPDRKPAPRGLRPWMTATVRNSFFYVYLNDKKGLRIRISAYFFKTCIWICTFLDCFAILSFCLLRMKAKYNFDVLYLNAWMN